MARSFDGIDDRVSCGVLGSLDSAVNASYSAWVYRASTSGTVAFGQYVNPNRFSALWYLDSNVYCSTENASNAFGFFTKSETGWHNLVIAFDGGGATNADRIKAYWDGVAQTLTFSGTVPTNLAGSGSQSSWEFGRDNSVSTDRFWAGSVAECGVWDATLTAEEATVLGKGACPLLVRPQNLFFYMPLWGRHSPEPELLGRAEGTVSGAAHADHPRVVYPARRRLIHVPGVAAAGNPWYAYAQQM